MGSQRVGHNWDAEEDLSFYLLLLFFSQLFVRPPQTTILPLFFFCGGGGGRVDGFDTASYKMLQISSHGSSGTLSDLIPLICHFHCITIRDLI